MPQTSAMLNIFRTADSTRLALVGLLAILFMRCGMSGRVTSGALGWPRIGMLYRLP